MNFLEVPVFLDHGEARKHSIFLVGAIAAPGGLRLNPSALVESNFLPLVSEAVVVVKSIRTLRHFSLLNKIGVDLIEKSEALVDLNFIQVGLGVEELLEFVVVDLSSDEAGGVLAIDLCNLGAHCTDGIGRTQVQLAFVIGVACLDLEGDEV